MLEVTEQRPMNNEYANSIMSAQIHELANCYL